MVAKNFALLYATALMQLQPTAASPVAAALASLLDDTPLSTWTNPVRRNTSEVDPPKNIVPVVNTVPKMTQAELDALIKSVKPTSQKPTRSLPEDELVSKRQAPAKIQGADGALLTFIDGERLPGTNATGCKDFELKGPFTKLHFYMGSNNIRGVTVTSIDGVVTTVGNIKTFEVDAGSITLAPNERITKFNVGRTPNQKGIRGFNFETDANQKYEAISGLQKAGTDAPVYEALNVGEGILGRMQGTACDVIMGSFSFDILDKLDSIAITDIDYSGFTNNIMPAHKGTPMSVGSQILDNRNSSAEQTISLVTNDAVTKTTAITTQMRYMIGNSVSVEAGAKLPFLASGKVSTTVDWQVERTHAKQETEGHVTTKSGTFALTCPAGKFCTAQAFFTQFKLDVKISAVFTAVSQTGGKFNWTQSGTYKGADSMAMQFNVTEVDNIV